MGEQNKYSSFLRYKINTLSLFLHFTELCSLPMNVQLMEVSSNNQLIFNWDLGEARLCPQLHYSIQASGCGICPNSTTSNSVTCTDLQVTEQRVCNFTVNIAGCDNKNGIRPNNHVEVALKGKSYNSYIYMYCNSS